MSSPRIAAISTNNLADTFNGVGTNIAFTATMAGGEEMKLGETMTVTLNNSANVTLTTSNLDANTMVGTYTVGAEDADTSALEIASYSVGTAVDLSGNLLADDTLLSNIDNILANVAIDTTAPNLTIETYVSPNLILAFNESITQASADLLLAIVEGATKSGTDVVTGNAWSSDSTATADVLAETTSSTALTLDGNAGTIVAGMTVTGTGISGTVTVDTVTDQNTIVLSSAQTLAEDAALTFTNNTTFKIAADALSVGDSLLISATADVLAATTASTALTLDGNAGTIVAGMTVTGTGISGTVTVDTVTDQNTIVLSSAQTLAEDAELTFAPTVEDFAGNTLIIETLEII